MSNELVVKQEITKIGRKLLVRSRKNMLSARKGIRLAALHNVLAPLLKSKPVFVLNRLVLSAFSEN